MNVAAAFVSPPDLIGSSREDPLHGFVRGCDPAIGEHFEHERDFNSLVRTSRALCGVLNRKLYSDHVRFHGSWALTWAAEHDSVDTAKRLLAVGADALARTTVKVRMPPIVVVARNNSLAMLKLLCETEGVDPDWAEKGTLPAIVWAVQMRFEEMTAYLLADPRVDPQRQGHHRRILLTFAAEHGLAKTTEMLLRDPRVDSAAPDIHGLTALSYAAMSERDSAEVIRVLLADPRVDPHHVDSDGCTALTPATGYAHIANLRALLDAGLDVNHSDGDGRSALFSAALNRREDAVELLLAHPHIDVNLADSEGETALMYSVDLGNPDVVKLLINDRRVLVKAVAADGATALIYAVSSIEDELRLILSNPDVDVNYGAKEGESAMHDAINIGALDSVRILIEDERLDVDILDGSDWPPIARAARTNQHNIARVLCLDGRFALNEVDDRGRNVLSYSAEFHAVKYVKLILERAEELGLAHRMNIEDNRGLTPLGYASRRQRKDVVALLDEFQMSNQLRAGFVGSSSCVCGIACVCE